MSSCLNEALDGLEGMVGGLEEPGLSPAPKDCPNEGDGCLDLDCLIAEEITR